jgi:hypothetical protein
MEYWNGGKMEEWVCKAECHLFYKRSLSAKPSIPSFQFSNTPKHLIMVSRRINFDLAQRAEFLMLKKLTFRK